MKKWKHIYRRLKTCYIEIKVFWYILIVRWRCSWRSSILLRNWAWPKTSTLAWGALGTAAISGFLADLSWRTGRNMAQRGLRTFSEHHWKALNSSDIWICLARFFVDGKAWFSAGCEQQDFAFVEQMVRRELSKVQLSGNDPQQIDENRMFSNTHQIRSRNKSHDIAFWCFLSRFCTLDSNSPNLTKARGEDVIIFDGSWGDNPVRWQAGRLG